ncbi:hypothetical protein TR51_17010 [Kitasatospora griseola]|uniref:ATP synthase subunit E n=1 Tax=Kitasatospora griseola TaxID=2064 RepID=A0A0D0PZ03_KITGR|nr:hypothetical protein [Kitasatospora griseola]KIQ65547.1 hypothetical protein TR51_17010 [Kitasatospora griseola]
MTPPPPDRTDAALAPVHSELLRQADVEARQLLTRADREATAVLDAARERAEEILAQARRDGTAEGEAAGAAELLRARRTARAREQTARRDAYDELRRRVTARVRAERLAADYPGVRDRLEQRARELLGARATVTEAPSGGVVAEMAGRLADLSLDALAGRALARLGERTEWLWTP